MKRDHPDTERGSRYGKSHKAVWDSVHFPGLTQAAAAIPHLLEGLPKRFAVARYREELPCLWIVFVGGTGTGKSTLFNAFCGEEISATGRERPKTRGAILYCHKDCPIEKGFPFPDYPTKRLPVGEFQSKPAEGMSGHLLIRQHQRDAWFRIVVADTPDLDSVAPEHREVAQNLSLLADRVVFVTSQEKYADDVPYHFLARVIRQGDPFFFLLNKAHGDLTAQEVRTTLEREGVAFVAEPIWFVPWQPSMSSENLSRHPDFQGFVASLSEELFGKDPLEIHRTTQKKRSKELAKSLGELIQLLESENRAAQPWLHRLDQLHSRTSQDLLRSEKEQFADHSRRHLAREIRRLFGRYDVLAGPRKFLRDILLKPLRLVGLGKAPEEQSLEEQLQKIRDRMDVTPLVAALEAFHRSVLENLSPPSENAPLFEALRQPDLPLSQEEVRERVWKQQTLLASWLEEKFQELSKGIPTSKKMGIYGTSLMWGILIIVFETTIGGGFTVLDAALDSVLAPLVTKGTVELFAYREIQSVARELAKRYETGLMSLLDEQRERYEKILRSLMTGPDTLQQLKSMRTQTTNG